jgi:hypothetical protein
MNARLYRDISTDPKVLIDEFNVSKMMDKVIARNEAKKYSIQK